MNKRIFKKITSNNYIYPTRKIRKIFKNIKFGLSYEEAITWFKVLERIKIKNKLLHDCFKSRKYLIKASGRAGRVEWLKELHPSYYGL